MDLVLAGALLLLPVALVLAVASLVLRGLGRMRAALLTAAAGTGTAAVATLVLAGVVLVAVLGDDLRVSFLAVVEGCLLLLAIGSAVLTTQLLRQARPAGAGNARDRGGR